MSATTIKEKATSSRRRLRPYTDDDREAVISIVREVWPEASADIEALWDWRHVLDKRAASTFDGSAVICEKGLVVGYCGVHPNAMKLGNRRITAGATMDLLTHPKSRGAGIRLVKTLLHDVPMLFGSGTERAKELWRRLHGRDVNVRPVRKMILVIDPSYALKRLKIPSIMNTPVKIVLSALRWSKKRRFESNCRFEQVASFSEEVDDFCETFSQGFENINTRGQAYLNWRYRDAPIDYTCIQLYQGNDLVGILVYRLTHKDGRKILLVLETMAVGDAETIYMEMAQFLIRRAEEAEVSEIQTFESGCPVQRRALRKYMFVLRQDPVQTVIASVSPKLEMSDDEIVEAYEDSNWFFSAGDADFEFTFFDQRVDRKLNITSKED